MYSRYGEDLMIADIFKQMGMNKPSFLSLYDPLDRESAFYSNTKIFADRGALGIEIKVHNGSLNEIINAKFNRNFPDLINIDQEDLAPDLLGTAIFTNSMQPRVIVVRVAIRKTRELTKILDTQGFHAYCRMGNYNFYINRLFWQNFLVSLGSR